MPLDEAELNCRNNTVIVASLFIGCIMRRTQPMFDERAGTIFNASSRSVALFPISRNQRTESRGYQLPLRPLVSSIPNDEANIGDANRNHIFRRSVWFTSSRRFPHHDIASNPALSTSSSALSRKSTSLCEESLLLVIRRTEQNLR